MAPDLVPVVEVLGDTHGIMDHPASSTMDRMDVCILDILFVCLADVDIDTCNRTVV